MITFAVTQSDKQEEGINMYRMTVLFFEIGMTALSTMDAVIFVNFA